jgi:Protein of unknown function (DUF2934)
VDEDAVRRQRQRQLQRRIREVAYLLWEASGRDHRRTLDFWLAAEREVLSEMPSSDIGVPDPRKETADAPPPREDEPAEGASVEGSESRQ